MTKKNNKQNFVFESKQENIRLVEKFVDEICDYYNINSSFFGNIIIAITEAVKNAIKHGNHDNPNKKISITFEYKPKGLSFIIEDEGDGFDFLNIPDPTDPKNISQNSHKGIFLMKKLADEISFFNNGSAVELTFHITPIDKIFSSDRTKKLLNITQQIIKNKN
jgi:serine/threonine-protein kinase RsbW